MTDFTFTTSKETIDAAAEDTDSVAMYNAGNISVELSDEYLDYLIRLAEARYDSGTGMPDSNQHYADDEQSDVNVSSLAGEGGLHIAYDEWELDEEIYENGGDGGLDGVLKLGGELMDVDVKCPTSQYSGDPWLKVHATKRNYADAYVLASYEDGEVSYHGWISSEELCREEHRSSKTGVDNYLITDTDDLNDMPPLTVASKSVPESEGFSLLEAAGD